ncbi:sodium/calcium exchanger family protein [Actinokineospora spheciospongiae]|uniref:Sodium/calcium exchanger family protein n=1 Tax=Actinokineospora spheciospongiae TaxID=909613 RepID=W7JD32_9PSEU|nr:sodium:proton exchanger [Actinokineospora spheciospongiae]EWC63914.1 sodium/calcium exchanger family protein [Actinokineospora spheciospongiae]
MLSRAAIPLWAAVALTVPGVFLGATGTHIAPPVDAVLFGIAVVGAAFVLSWVAEAVQLDISPGLAITLLALIAVLPEYAVDFVFTAEGGSAFAEHGPTCLPPDAAEGTESPCGLALANMTGANRILVGIGWAAVVLIATWRIHRNRVAGETPGDPERKARSPKQATVSLERTDSVPLAFLALATLYSLTLPLRHTITLVDAVVLVGIFVLYAVRVARAPAGDPELDGVAAVVGGQSKTARRVWCLAMFTFAAAVILLVAENFAHSLVETGTELGVSQFLLVQWVAPLASEAPELLVAGLYAWRLKTTDALATLVSSKVNQWTLLVGTLPIVFAIAAGGLNGLPLDGPQREELLLTAAQSLFAVTLLLGLTITVRGALTLLGLFLAQFVLAAVLPASVKGIELIALSGVYLVLALITAVRQRHHVRRLLRDGYRTPYRELADA